MRSRTKRVGHTLLSSVKLGALLSNYLGGALYKFLNEWMNEWLKRMVVDNLRHGWSCELLQCSVLSVISKSRQYYYRAFQHWPFENWRVWGIKHILKSPYFYSNQTYQNCTSIFYFHATFDQFYHLLCHKLAQILDPLP